MTDTPGINLIEEMNNAMIHSSNHIKCGSEYIEIPKICCQCEISLKHQKISLCIFCDPVRAFC